MIPGAVLRAFGLPLDVPLRPIGRAFAAGGLVLKRVDDAATAAWTSETLATLEADGIRLAPPARAVDGRWVVDGWTATERIEGRVSRDWRGILRAGAAFHRATARLPRPEVLDTRTDVWAVADRAAWGEQDPPRASPLVDAVTARVRPLDLRSQVVHGDLSGNVLVADGLPPAVIDVSPYWRPPGWALAVVVVDAVVWGRAGFDLVDALDTDERGELLARATLFRLFCDSDIEPHRPWVTHLCRLLDDGT